MFRQFRNTVLLFVVLTLAPAAVPASAQVYDASADFSTASNPNGVWSYGWSSMLGSSFNLDLNVGIGTPIEGWAGSVQTGNGRFPAIVHNKTNMQITTGTQTFQPNQVIAHPGPDGEYSVLRWTAPSTGTWTLNAVFDGQDVVGTTTDVHVLLDGAALFNGNVNGYLATSSFSQSIVVAAGDTIDFAVGYGANHNYYYDSTGVAATIQSASTAVPEPGPVAMLMGTAFAGGSLLLRRRRK